MDAGGLVEFERHRPRLFALAYRLLGSASEAEDAVQETGLHWNAVNDRGEIRSAETWLTTALVNHCRAGLISARARRKSYTGPWLPEPVQTGHGELGPLESAEQRELLSMAVLSGLELLTPAERAVFVLREAFGYAHREIADMINLSEADSQLLYRRATQQVRADRPRFDPAPAAARAPFQKLLTAARSGAIDALEALLAADIVATADGGGRVGAPRHPISGRDRVARYLAGLLARDLPGLEITIEEVNAAPAFVARVAGTAVLIATADLVEDRVSALRLVVNPDKLAYFIRADKVSR
ncbi:sigma-70 family RNA polymerase sigma factor [Nocardia sp. NPDC051030]|uniref:sigma-70 family RNA polymerase sigma factor n=1 Tax=Nocardia sp. NPDC051030 TaxID=3155162 RepID=UPI0034330875